MFEIKVNQPLRCFQLNLVIIKPIGSSLLWSLIKSSFESSTKIMIKSSFQSSTRIMVKSALDTFKVIQWEIKLSFF